MCEDEDRQIDKISQILDMNFISIKNMRWQFGKSYKLFYFQVRGSPVPLNIPTPTPAPDRGGPIACLSGPVTVAQKVAKNRLNSFCLFSPIGVHWRRGSHIFEYRYICLAASSHSISVGLLRLC